MVVQQQTASVEQKKAAKKESNKRQNDWLGSIGHYIAVVFVVFLALAPLYWTFITSVKNGVEMFVSPPTLFPHSYDLSNYVQVINSSFFLPTLKNSALIALF